MRKYFNHIIISLAFIFFALIANADEPVKRVYKSWPVENVSEIIIDNQFGNIDFVTPRTDSVSIEATFDIQNLSKNNAEYLGEQVKFNISSSNGTLKIETSFTENFKTNKDFKIRIRVQIPEDCNVDITNRFGDVNMNNLKAQGNFNIEYGNLKANRLNSTNNTPINLDIKYGRADIEYSNNLTTQLNYGEMYCVDIEKLNLKSQYSILNLKNIDSAKISSYLDNISMDTLDSITIESNYSTINIKELSKFLDINMKHGELSVDQTDNGFDQINIDNHYGKVFIKTGNQVSYTLQSETFFTEIDYINGTIIEHKTLKDQIYLKSNIGSEENNSHIEVKSRYGTVHITR
jgi:hypothetical protein